jgi:hypothetical protein
LVRLIAARICIDDLGAVTISWSTSGRAHCGMAMAEICPGARTLRKNCHLNEGPLTN